MFEVGILVFDISTWINMQVKVAWRSTNDTETTAPNNSASRTLRTLTSSGAFDIISTTFILMNAMCLVSDHANKSKNFEQFLKVVDLVFWAGMEYTILYDTLCIVI